MEADEERDELIAGIDNIRTYTWNPPEKMAAKEWWRTSVSTSGASALQSVANMFAAFMPRWDVKARAPGEQDNAELLERWLEWNFWLANSRPSKSSPLWDIVYSAAAYDVVAARVEYLPFFYGKDKEKWTKRQKLAMRNGPFVIKTYHPSSVHYGVGDTMPEWAATVRNLTASDLYNEWVAQVSDTEEGRKVKKATDKLKEWVEEEKRVVCVDYEDIETRWVFFYETARTEINYEELEGDIETFDIVNKSTDTEFFPWVISVGGSGYSTDPIDSINPMLGGMIRSGMWQNINLYRSMKESDIVREFGQPKRLWTTADGQPKTVDYEDGGDVAVQQGEGFQVLPPAQFNMAFQQMLSEREGEVGSLTNVQVLQDPKLVGGLQYSTVNAMLQVALSRLTTPKNVAQKALTQIGRLFFDWVNYTGDTTIAYRMTAAGKTPEMMRGAQIVMRPEVDFDVENMYVSCELMPNTPTDKVAKMNMYLQASQNWRVPESEFVEELFGDPKALSGEWEQEQVEKAAMQIFVKEKNAAVDMKIQQATMQMQMQAQSANVSMAGGQQPGQVPQPKGAEQPMATAMTGEGYNAANGGQSTMPGAPGMTREAVTGQDMAGQSPAGGA